jgi:hypothetical protein
MTTHTNLFPRLRLEPRVPRHITNDEQGHPLIVHRDFDEIVRIEEMSDIITDLFMDLGEVSKECQSCEVGLVG